MCPECFGLAWALVIGSIAGAVFLSEALEKFLKRRKKNGIKANHKKRW